MLAWSQRGELPHAVLPSEGSSEASSLKTICSIAAVSLVHYSCRIVNDARLSYTRSQKPCRPGKRLLSPLFSHLLLPPTLSSSTPTSGGLDGHSASRGRAYARLLHDSATQPGSRLPVSSPYRWRLPPPTPARVRSPNRKLSPLLRTPRDTHERRFGRARSQLGFCGPGGEARTGERNAGGGTA